MNVIASRLWPGITFAVLSAVLFGASTPLAKLLMVAVDPWLMAGLLYLGAGIGLLAVRFIARATGRLNVQAPLRRGDIPLLAAVVALGGMIAPLLLMLGLARTQGATASLLLNFESLATLAIAWVAFRENVDARLFIGAMAILAGAVLLSWGGDGFAIDGGALFVLAACICWAIDNNLTRKLSAADPVEIAMIKGLAAGGTNFVLAMSLGAQLPALPIAVAVGLVGFLGYGVSLVLFILALRHLGTARTGAYFALAPFIGAALSIPLLGEALTQRIVLAGLLMAIGLWLHLAERHEHRHAHESLEHEHLHTHDPHHVHRHEPNDPPGEPHSHNHRHGDLVHSHAHYPDLHHRHRHV